jgi:SAM-dependent methyltransferase
MTSADFKNLRSGRHTVKGTEQLICVRTVPTVLKVLARKKLRGALNLACRTGQFLIELARSEPTLHGIGVDKAAERITAARAKALDYGVAPRLQFVTAEIGRDPLLLGDELANKIDVVIALYFFHEVARFGRPKVVGMLQQIKTMFPGRLLLFMETLPYDNQPQGNKPPQTFSQLDYLLIHHIRDQGLPLPSAEWKSILEEAGLKLVEFQEIYWAGLYLAEM